LIARIVSGIIQALLGAVIVIVTIVFHAVILALLLLILACLLVVSHLGFQERRNKVLGISSINSSSAASPITVV